MTTLGDIADKIADRLAAEGYQSDRKEILVALRARRDEVAGQMRVTPQTAQRYFTDATVDAWVDNIRRGAQELGIAPTP